MKKKISELKLGGLKKLEEVSSVSHEEKIYTGEEDPTEWKQFFDFSDMYAGQEITKDSAMLENYQLPDKWVHL